MAGSWRKLKTLLSSRSCAVSPFHPECAILDLETSDEVAAVGTIEQVSDMSSTDYISPQLQGGSSSQSLPRSMTRLSRGTCSICLEAMKPGLGHALFTAECSHTFHFSCIASSVRYGNIVCPVCRGRWKEVPWLAPIERKASKPPTPLRSLLRTQHALPNQSDTAATGYGQPSPMLGQLIGNTHVLQTSCLEPFVYNDDEPILTQMDFQDCENMNEGEQSTDAERSKQTTDARDTEECGNIKEGETLNRDEAQGRALEMILHPEFSVVAASETFFSFTVLVHLKAPPVSPRDGKENLPPFQMMDRCRRAPLDLVTVLDISGSMAGTKLALLKQAMCFVIQNLNHSDRLSVVVFSSSARRILSLRRMGEEGRQQASEAVGDLVAAGGTDIGQGLRKGVRILDDRRERNPVSAIMLLSDGQDTYPRRSIDYRCLAPATITNNGQYGYKQIPVHTFGFGADHDAATMHNISEVSGGTFSFIQNEAVVQDAFAQCIGGLLSVVVQDVQLTVSCCSTDVEISAVEAGSYESNITDAAKRGLAKLGDMYAEEERDILVELKLPSQTEASSMLILQAGCMYKDLLTQEVLNIPSHDLFISRPLTVSGDLRQMTNIDVDRQRNRLHVAKAIVEARSLADRGDISAAQQALRSAKAILQESVSAKAGDHLCSALEAELEEIQLRMTNKHLYERTGRAYLLSAQSSHLLQRATTRGESLSLHTHSQDYQTPSMVDMILRSQVLSSPLVSNTGL